MIDLINEPANMSIYWRVSSNNDFEDFILGCVATGYTVKQSPYSQSEYFFFSATGKYVLAHSEVLNECWIVYRVDNYKASMAIVSEIITISKFNHKAGLPASNQ